MVCVGALVKLKYKTMATFFDPQKGLKECWLENVNPGIVVSVSHNVPVQMCDVVFGDQVYYGIAQEDVEIVRKL
jgi:hypothetical protein